MPATEATWRDTKLLHRVFAVTGVLMTIGTVWMFWKDHARSWKTYQVEINNIDLKMNALRQEQYRTGDALVENQRRERELAQAKARPVEKALVDDFIDKANKLNEVLRKWKEHHAYSLIAFDASKLERPSERLTQLSQAAAKARAEADAAEKAADASLAALQAKPDDQALHKDLAEKQRIAREKQEGAARAETAAANARGEVTEYMQWVVSEARRREDKALGIRKFKSGEIDAAKAEVDIGIRDNLPPEERKAREDKVAELMGVMANGDEEAEQGKETLAALNAIYQSLSAGRLGLDRTLKQVTAEVEQAQKAYDESVAELERLRKQKEEREERLLFSNRYPWIFGKQLLTLPILDAFNSPRKIENLWSDGLMQNYNFSYVRRFDRCTTCHQSLAKTMPGAPTTPAYVHEEDLDFVVVPPPKDAPPKPRLDDQGKPKKLTAEEALEDWLGMRLADEGLLRPDDVTVALVLPKSPAARAEIEALLPSGEQALGSEIRQAVAQFVSAPGSGETPQTAPPAMGGTPQRAFPTEAGLMTGDVIVGINGQPLATSGGDRSPERIAYRLRALAEEGKPIRLTIRRGMPNPYISHPRLDLYVADASPHRMQTFACTICHEGQGSATAFEWASHTPNSTIQMREWIQEHGWFDNHHWIYPMNARRFTESACLKCHHEVVELEANEKFPDPPAPKVTHGYQLIRKYGCYGCHEVNGFDGPSRRVGPDLRSEPNYFAVAQQIDAELNAAEANGGGERLTYWKEQLGEMTPTVAAKPEDGATRNRLRTTIEEGVAQAGENATRLDKQLAILANMLRDVEVPGTLRRAGPSLRYIAKKADPVFVYDWIADPQNFRPTTRMPKFFGLWGHLKDDHGQVKDAKAPKLEPIEIRGILAYIDDYSPSQKFEFEERPSGMSEWTEEEKIARGKTQFQTRGCLACHDHKDFPEVSKYRSPEEIVQGPDLSGVGTKFSAERNSNGPDWLYSWIKNPSRYHARTLMPVLFLDPEQDPGANAMSTDDDKWFDPADDIVAYLLSSSTNDWQPIEQARGVTQPLAEDDPALKELILEYLNEAFYKEMAERYYLYGIPPELEGELKGAEKDLIVRSGERLTNKQRLKYIGRKTIAKYGCFGCHDIPGFENEKPIGTNLADWGRKDPARLAFEHITHYIEHGHGHAAHAADAKARPDQKTRASDEAMYADSPAKSKQATPKTTEQQHAERTETQTSSTQAAHKGDEEPEELKEFYTHALEAGNRIGFIYQKLKEPRSYDFEKTDIKRYNERLRMPQFPFTAHEREALITFVLGLVAEPPQPKYIFQAKERNAALVAGRKVLEKYNCGGCHILGLEKWQISYAPGEFGERPLPEMYPFLKPHFSPQELAADAKPDRRNELHSTLVGLPPADRQDGLPTVLDIDGGILDNESPYAERELKLGLDLYQHAIVDGSPYVTGQQPVFASTAQIDSRYPTWGGVLTKYLLPVVTKLEREVNPNASGSEAYGWLPPPLINEGNKVQTAWLHDFLLEPYPIRPAVFLRMPKFNMSSEEATALANYFAAVDNADFPYAYAANRDRSRLAALETGYVSNGQGTGGRRQETGDREQVSAEAPPGMQRLDDAMKIVTNGNFCVKCHLVADYTPPGSQRARAPNLADVYRRLRPDYVRDWIANPKMFLPYTSMPVNIPYQDPPPLLSELYHGSNVEQVQALTDLLMNYDQYARQSTRIADRVQPAPMEGTAPATSSGSSPASSSGSSPASSSGSSPATSNGSGSGSN